ncbi:hypothetical protein [Salipiger abyssi]|uniref:hypothetical protein n=1 Tax=Salipiger abyssi TaxID=1250539 RepID=UPI0040596364
MRQRIWTIFLVTGLGLGAAPAWAENASYRFEWQGSGGYAMRGALSFDAALLGREEVRASDLTCFVIEGYRDSEPIGRWALGMLNEETTWSLSFRPSGPEFIVFGPGHPMPQAWNMDGAGTDCGPGGFGFNIGNAAQDLCLDGRLVIGSQVDPSRPFPAVRDDDVPFPSDGCMGPMLMSKLPERVVPASFEIEKDSDHGQN